MESVIVIWKMYEALPLAPGFIVQREARFANYR